MLKLHDFIGIGLMMSTIAIAIFFAFNLEVESGNKFVQYYDSNFLTWDKKFIIEAMWSIETNAFRFDWLLGFQVFFVWLRFISYFKYIRIFGTMFNVIISMLKSLFQFLLFFIVTLGMFSCVAVLIFG